MPLLSSFPGHAMRALLLVVFFTLSPPGLAQQHPSPGTGFTGYHHTAWRAGQGAPGDIWDIQQDPNGTLWLATGSGLYSFDGHRYVRQQTNAGAAQPSLNLVTLRGDRSGGLWLGYYHAGIAHLGSDGTLRSYQRNEGVPPGVVSGFAYDSNGVLWAAVDEGLRRFNGTRWEKPPASMGLPERHAHWLLNDSRGRFWALVGQKVWFIPKGGAAFVPTGIEVSLMATLAESPSGEIWLADRRRGAVPIADANGLLPAAERQARLLPDVLASRLHFTSDGAMWAPMRGGGGILRVLFDGKHAVRMERFDVPQGLTSTSAVPVFEDREGNVWVGTNLGLNRFRAQSVRTLTEGPNDPYRILARNAGGALFGYGEDMVPYDLDRHGLGLDRAGLQRAALRDTRPLWQFEWTSLARRRGTALEVVQFPGTARGLQPQALHFPGAEEAWACVGENRVVHYLRGSWTEDARITLPGCTVIAPGSAQDLLFGYASGELVLRDATGVHHIGSTRGLDAGPVTAVLAHEHVLLVAGEKGFSISSNGGAFSAVTADIPGVLEGITGIVIDPDQQVWLNGGRGLVRLDLADAIASARTGNAVSPRLFDDVDGMPGIALQSGPIPTAQLSKDGLLWLATNQGLAWLDTTRLHRTRAAPSARIGDVHFGDETLPLRDGTVVPAGITQLQIDFVAQSLARPERNRYRYRLSGVDPGWRDAGSATTAYYTNLGPGSYTFEVLAANEDGVWGSAPTTRAFRIEPLLTQTFWFRGLLLIALVVLVAAAARVRGRHITALVKARYEERLEERERIARDLHDTLLQGGQGLLLRLHAISAMPSLPDEAQARLESAMQAAEDSLREGRERVASLRSDTGAGLDLGAALTHVYNEETNPAGTRLRVVVSGEAPRLNDAAAEEVFLIGREAIRNALAHSAATDIDIELSFGHTFRLRVRDNGRGMVEGTVKQGRWGVQGMHERSARLGGTLRIWSRPARGTDVALSVPGVRLYARQQAVAPKRWHAFFRRGRARQG